MERISPLTERQWSASGAHLADAVAALNPAISIRRLADIGHYPQTEAPDRVVQTYREFRAGL